MRLPDRRRKFQPGYLCRTRGVSPILLKESGLHLGLDFAEVGIGEVAGADAFDHLITEVGDECNHALTEIIPAIFGESHCLHALGQRLFQRADVSGSESDDSGLLVIEKRSHLFEEGLGLGIESLIFDLSFAIFLLEIAETVEVLFDAVLNQAALTLAHFSGSDDIAATLQTSSQGVIGNLITSVHLESRFRLKALSHAVGEGIHSPEGGLSRILLLGS